jgi:phosphoglycolate phosphatase
MLKYATIVFDLDGTLVDTAPDLTNALNHALAARGHAPVTLASIRSAVGRGARAMIEEALALAGMADDVDRMLAAFLVLTKRISRKKAGPFPARWRRSSGLRRRARDLRSAPTSARA